MFNKNLCKKFLKALQYTVYSVNVQNPRCKK
nr:MAG TPA: hypothetical protein [Caudoviricetes sp.]